MQHRQLQVTHGQAAHAHHPVLCPEPTLRVPLGASEQLFLALHGFTATNVVRMIALEGALRPQQIEPLLPLLQARHPLLQMRVSQAEGGAEFRHDAALRIELEVLSRRDDQQWPVELERLLNSPISHEHGPLLRLHHLHHPGQRRSELFIVCDHVICDGISINALCAELLALCAGASVAPPRPLLPSLAELLPSFSGRQRASAVGGQLARLALVSISRRRGERLRPGKTTRFLSVALSREQTQALVTRSRAEQTTVTALLMAATLLSVPAERSARLSLSLPVNLRPLLRGRELAADDLGHLTSMVFLTTKRDTALFPFARALKQMLGKPLEEQRMLAALEPTYEVARRLLRASNPPLAHALVSSSGVVPLQRDYGAFRVLDFYSGTSAVMLSADYGLFCNTFDGRLRINLVTLQETVARERAVRLLDSVFNHLSIAP